MSSMSMNRLGPSAFRKTEKNIPKFSIADGLNRFFDPRDLHLSFIGKNRHFLKITFFWRKKRNVICLMLITECCDHLISSELSVGRKT
jgi:hypothetical protein